MNEAVDSCKRTPKAKVRIRPGATSARRAADSTTIDPKATVPTIVVDHAEMAEPTVDMVALQIYDLSERHMAHWRATGMQYSPYHSGLEIYGREYSFPMPLDDLDVPADVVENDPRECALHRFRNSMSMGYTSVAPREVLQIVDELKQEWNCSTYRALGNNCHAFTEAFCKRLGVGRSGLPDWVKNAVTARRGRVVVRVYDLGQTFVTRGYNAVAKSYGAFHSGVEVYGKEWSFGMVCDDVSTGVGWNEPGMCENHSFREMLSMGWTRYSEEDVDLILQEMTQEWMGNSYDLFSRNCHNFSEALLARLGVACLPSWVNHLASSFAAGPPAAAEPPPNALDQSGQGGDSRP